MNKTEFILAAKEYFKKLGYRKHRNYWFLACDEIVYCVFLQNSQWSKDDYYVEVGIALRKEVGERPCLTDWYVRKSCPDEREYYTNVSLDDEIRAMDFYKEIHSIDELKQYMEKTPHIALGLQDELL